MLTAAWIMSVAEKQTTTDACRRSKRKARSQLRPVAYVCVARQEYSGQTAALAIRGAGDRCGIDNILARRPAGISTQR
jgi:hypothetical protein